MKYIYLLIFFVVVSADLMAQSYAFGIKGGPSIALQRWNGFQGNDPLFAWHAIAFIETADEDSRGSLFAEGGYHARGRGLRFRASINPNTGIPYEAQNFQLRFNNASLAIGGRNKFDIGGASLGFYSFALRGEYNISHDLELYQGYTDGIQKFVYGISLGGGLEFPFSEFVAGILDIRFSPDISRQIFIPASRFNNPFTGTQEIFGEQNIKNITFEISVGLRFLNKVIYVD